MKLHIWEQIERRLHHQAANPAPQPSDETPKEPVHTGNRFRAWLSELSESLVNIDRSGKGGPPRPH